MAAGPLALVNDLAIEQGSLFSLGMTVQQPKGTAYNLTGFTARASLKQNYTDTNPIISFTVAILVPTDGTLNVSLSSTQTASLTPGDYVWDLLIDNGAGTVIRLVQGAVIVTPRVTA